MLMRKQVFAGLMILGFAVVLVACKNETRAEAGSPQADVVMTDEVAVPGAWESEAVVTVNGERLLRADIDRQMQAVLGSPQFAALPPEQAAMIMQQVEGQIVNQFIDQTLLRGAADAADVEIMDEEVDTYIAELREYFGDGDSLEIRMSMQGITMEDLRRDIIADMKIRTLLDQMTESVAKADDEKVQAFYDENREMFGVPESVSARHILVRVDREADDDARSAARAEIDGIREKLLAGEVAFETAAAEHSSCPSKERGGDLGQFGRGQMVPSFDAAAFEQPIGVVGDVVETEFGYHLILVTDRQEASEQSFEDVREDIAEQLVMGEKQEMVRGYLERLRAEADISYAE